MGILFRKAIAKVVLSRRGSCLTLRASRTARTLTNQPVFR